MDRKPNPVRLRAALRRRLGVTTIPLGPALLAGSSDLPGGFGRAVLFSHPAACAARRWAPPYLVLLRAGFCLPSSLAADAVRSYRTFSPLPASALGPRAKAGGMFSVPLSFGLRRPGVTRRTALWSSDFPPSTSALGPCGPRASADGDRLVRYGGIQ